MGAMVDAPTEDHAWRTTIALAHRHRLTLYGAACLELPARRPLRASPHLTLDHIPDRFFQEHAIEPRQFLQAGG
jgi:hypothetical protein